VRILSTWKTSFVAREICSIPTPSRLPNAIQRSAHRDAARAELGAARARLADTDIRAPVAGRVGLGYVGLGRLVTPQAVITTLDDTDIINLDFDVPATWISPGHVATPGLTRRT